MGRLALFMAKTFPKASTKYSKWESKRRSEAPARELKKKQKAFIRTERMNERISQLQTKNRLIKVQNQGIALKKQRLKTTLGFFTGTRTLRAPVRVNRRISVRKRPRRAYRYERYEERQRNRPEERKEHSRMWFEG